MRTALPALAVQLVHAFGVPSESPCVQSCSEAPEHGTLSMLQVVARRHEHERLASARGAHGALSLLMTEANASDFRASRALLTHGQHLITRPPELPPGPAGELAQHYFKIFRTGNRNSASHLWSNFLLRNSHKYSPGKFEELFSAFCGVSASVVDPADDTRWRLTLPVVGGGTRTGFMYYCSGCHGWPCLCDALDFVQVDTRTVALADGETRTYRFAVLGDPCSRPGDLTKSFIDPVSQREVTLKQVAPELACEGDHLRGAELSDSGHPIIAMFFDDDDRKAHRAPDFTAKCQERAAGGFKTGMGVIFRKLAEINPISGPPAKVAPFGSEETARKLEGQR